MFEKISQNLKDFFGERNELVDSANIALTDRLSSPFYGYFLLSWMIVNWKLPYVAFLLIKRRFLKRLIY